MSASSVTSFKCFNVITFYPVKMELTNFPFVTELYIIEEVE
jgi:hypothetical protein